MSEVKKMLEITPAKRCKKEQFEIDGFTCPACGGRKQFHEEIGRDEMQYTDCPFCQGAGKLSCKVQLTWNPDEKSS